MRRRTTPVLAAALGCAALCAPAMAKESTVVVDEALKRDLATVGTARVFFGHQSVGFNILDGVAALAQEAGTTVAIGDAAIGANGDAHGKFEAWAKHIEAIADVDIVALKLCYVDVATGANPAELLAGYQAAVARVRMAKPGVKVLHVTTPLTVRGSGLKSWLKRTLGGTPWSDQSNALRLAYNRGLRAAFPGEPIFDLAAIEATRPDGSKEEHVVDGQPVPMLWPGYAADEGHLNQEGKRVAARAFIAALAEALRK